MLKGGDLEQQHPCHPAEQDKKHGVEAEGGHANDGEDAEEGTDAKVPRRVETSDNFGRTE